MLGWAGKFNQSQVISTRDSTENSLRILGIKSLSSTHQSTPYEVPLSSSHCFLLMMVIWPIEFSLRISALFFVNN